MIGVGCAGDGIGSVVTPARMWRNGSLVHTASCANHLSQPCPSDRSGATLQGKYVIAQKQWPTAANEWCPSGYSVQKQIFQSLILGTNINEGRVAGSDA